MALAKWIAVTLVGVALLSINVPAASHPGQTNAEGCHTNRTTGEYHCHTPKTPAPNAITYCHVVDGERRCGYARSTCANLARQFGGACEVAQGTAP
jgi:hypothetical protein